MLNWFCIQVKRVEYGRRTENKTGLDTHQIGSYPTIDHISKNPNDLEDMDTTLIDRNYNNRKWFSKTNHYDQSFRDKSGNCLVQYKCL